MAYPREPSEPEQQNNAWRIFIGDMISLWFLRRRCIRHKRTTRASSPVHPLHCR
ncbi:hypothetical protein PITC_020250 [Penicillium italicum]|uniref:Uncharacterized protein n=1 Tax=Penicillium italicum TaxID=40296 RepID=A0A0A2KH41_PENIT|nr:hypothetical protein PITC_020250 [Penicillium italicum]